MKEIELVS